MHFLTASVVAERKFMPGSLSTVNGELMYPADVPSVMQGHLYLMHAAVKFELAICAPLHACSFSLAFIAAARFLSCVHDLPAVYK